MAKGVMSKFFVPRHGNDPALSNGITRLRNLLSSSVIENTNYDFKIGLHRLEEEGNFDEHVVKKVVKTLTAMVNQDPGSIGYVIVGVADNAAAANRYEKYYGNTPRSYKKFYVTGVQDEAKKYKSHDLYMKFVKDKINSLREVDTAFKSMITRHMEYLSFYDKTVLVFRVNNEGQPVRYDGKFYERNGSHIAEVTDEKLIWKRFL